MRTNLKLIKQDVTSDWNEDFLRGNRIKQCIDFYLVDLNRLTYLCELTPSVERNPYYSEFIPINEDKEIADSVYDSLMDNNICEVDYIHLSAAENATGKKYHNFSYRKGDEQQYYEEIDRVVEHLKGNPITF